MFVVSFFEFSLRSGVFCWDGRASGARRRKKKMVLMVGLDDDGNESTRKLGLVVARGTLLVLISPLDGSEEIANPFATGEEE